MRASEKTHFERIGGKGTLTEELVFFYRKVIGDDLLQSVSDKVDRTKQQLGFKAFLAISFGEPIKYTGHNLQTGHTPLRAKGHDEAYFGSISGHLQDTIKRTSCSKRFHHGSHVRCSDYP